MIAFTVGCAAIIAIGTLLGAISDRLFPEQGPS